MECDYNLYKRSDDMIKSVYSLMLFDEIVEKIDQIAYENNTNRSQLITTSWPKNRAGNAGTENSENSGTAGWKFQWHPVGVSQINKNSSIQFGKSLKYK